jgi:DNA-binding MarR family transcriptional regulator
MEQLNQTFFYTLEKAIKVYRHYFQLQLKNAGYAITVDQWLVLNMILDFKGITQTEIAERIFKDKASITRIIDLLETKDYVTRKPHPSGSPNSSFRLTLHGSRVPQEHRRRGWGSKKESEQQPNRVSIRTLFRNSTRLLSTDCSCY